LERFAKTKMQVEFNKNHLQKMILMYNLYNSKLGKSKKIAIEMESQQKENPTK
jgi:hypothetical protein